MSYCLEADFELPPLNLTVEALRLGIAMVSTWTGEVLSEPAKSLATKIETVISKSVQQEYQQIIYAPDLSFRQK